MKTTLYQVNIWIIVRPYLSMGLINALSPTVFLNNKISSGVQIECGHCWRKMEETPERPLFNRLRQSRVSTLVKLKSPGIWIFVELNFSAFTYHWTVGHSYVQPLDSLTEHYPTFRNLGTRLSDHSRVGKSKVLPLDCWTLSSQAIGQLEAA